MSIIYIKFKEIQEQKLKEAKTIAKLHKKLKLKNATEKEINLKILEYVSNLKDMYGFSLTEKQQNDPIFMIELYKANPQSLAYFSPSIELQDNTDFMVEFIKLELAKRKKIYQENKLVYDFINMKPSIKDILLDYRHLYYNPAFMRKIGYLLEDESE